MPKMVMTSSNSSEAKRWLIIGAYKAGASEKHVARIAGLSRTAVRHILLNYKRTGLPSLPEKEPHQVKAMPIVEYDQDGKLINMNDSEYHVEPTHEALAPPSRPTQHSTWKGKVTAKDLIAYVEQTRRSSKKSKDASLSKRATKTWRPPTPPHESSSSSISRLDSPASSADSLPPSPPLDGIGLNDEASNVSKTRHSSKYDQTIKGYELWTHDDDIILLEHVLSKLDGGRWHELESKLQGRHTARLCYERWKYLQRQLLKGVAKTSTK